MINCCRKRHCCTAGPVCREPACRRFSWMPASANYRNRERRVVSSTSAASPPDRQVWHPADDLLRSRRPFESSVSVLGSLPPLLRGCADTAGLREGAVLARAWPHFAFVSRSQGPPGSGAANPRRLVTPYSDLSRAESARPAPGLGVPSAQRHWG